MDWVKVKVKYYLELSDLTARDRDGYMKLMCLTAQLENVPTYKQMLTVCRRNTIETLTKFFQTMDKSLTNVLQKVVEVQRREEKRRGEKT